MFWVRCRVARQRKYSAIHGDVPPPQARPELKSGHTATTHAADFFRHLVYNWLFRALMEESYEAYPWKISWPEKSLDGARCHCRGRHGPARFAAKIPGQGK